jgi:hypothetical protein
VLGVCLIAAGVFVPADSALAAEALPAPVAGAHCKSGGVGLGETVTVGKATHTVVGVREIWARGTVMTYTTAEGLKTADPKIPMAYLYKVEDGHYVYFPTNGRDVHMLPDDSADSIFQFGGPITNSRGREADIKACFSGNLAAPGSSPAPAASP